MRFVAAALLLAGLAVAETSEAGKAWWAHIEFLASDALEGRKAGTEGHRKAARYVAEQFEKAGLKPAGTDGYLQRVPFRQRLIDEANSKIQIVRENGKVEPVEFGTEATLGTRGVSGEIVEADAVFVGHGLVIPEAGVNDLKGLDLKGKIAVILRGIPPGVAGPVASHASSSAEQWKTLQAAGAIGIATLFNSRVSDTPWTRTAAARLSPSLSLAGPGLEETEGQKVQMTISPTAADRFLAGTEHTYAEIMEAEKAHAALPVFPLKARIRVKASFTQSEVNSENVLGLFEGSDPKLKDEYIIYSAHVDHLGVGQAVATDPGDKIYNGAMDNASGIASMIEIAKSLKGKKLRRSVLFAAVTGEESGLLGSKYLANRPTVPARQIVADLNTDMFLPIIPLKGITVLGLEESDLGTLFVEMVGQYGVFAKPDPEPARNRFTRSDQYSFICNGIPSLAFKFHADLGTPENEVLAKWTKDRYHAPSDDLKQPVNIEGAVDFNRIMTAFLQTVADRDQRPMWKDTSFFKRFAQN